MIEIGRYEQIMRDDRLYPTCQSGIVIRFDNLHPNKPLANRCSNSRSRVINAKQQPLKIQYGGRWRDDFGKERVDYNAISSNKYHAWITVTCGIGKEKFF